MHILNVCILHNNPANLSSLSPIQQTAPFASCSQNPLFPLSPLGSVMTHGVSAAHGMMTHNDLVSLLRSMCGCVGGQWLSGISSGYPVWDYQSRCCQRGSLWSWEWIHGPLLSWEKPQLGLFLWLEFSIHQQPQCCLLFFFFRDFYQESVYYTCSEIRSQALSFCGMSNYICLIQVRNLKTQTKSFPLQQAQSSMGAHLKCTPPNAGDTAFLDTKGDQTVQQAASIPKLKGER